MQLEELFQKETKNTPGTLEQRSYYLKNYISWLEVTISQFKRPSNTQMQSEACDCKQRSDGADGCEDYITWGKCKRNLR
jgi:hypothetical protein